MGNRAKKLNTEVSNDPETLEKMVAGLSDDELEQTKRFLLAQVAKEHDDPAGFDAFYYVVMGQKLPKHCKKWIREVYDARNAGKGTVIEAFRGSTKTTTLTIAFTAWRIGRYPEAANLLIQVGDDIAQNNTKQIADIISHNPGWRLVFPAVVPDEALGWGASGYEVKRADLDYQIWRERNAKRKDPTLLGVGVKSSAIIGKHPDGVLIVDDIHDEKNTRSDRELALVREVLTGTIFPTMTPSTWAIFIGTPWVLNDALQYVVSTGLFAHVRTPVIEDEVPVWPERFNEAEIEKARRVSGRAQFARMFLLDLNELKNQTFKYLSYPNSEIKSLWPMVGGADYAGSMDVWVNRSGSGDYFAVAYLAKLPGGGAVVVDGVLARCTQAEAEQYINRPQQIYPYWIGTAVEGDGKGEEFIQVIKRNPGLKIVPFKTGGKGKAIRLVRQMGPWLENGTIRVSDADTPFLNELRHELDNYGASQVHDDCLDAVYWACRLIPDVLVLAPQDDELPAVNERTYRKRSSPNPFKYIGRRS